jgi:S-adenosyl-L-methionine hydrolase (adenosine-forming)
VPTRPRLVTLSSDTGSAYAAQMKGVLYRSLPPGHVVDLTHELPRHRVDEAAFLVRQMASTFPAGTVHVVIVDPGVGGDRAPIAIGTHDGSFLVGPDNGVLAPLAAHLGFVRAVRLDRGRMGPRAPVGRTFEGRDLFAPAAARLARGSNLVALGERWTPRSLELPEATITPRELRGVVMHLDHFGNAITNIPSLAVPPGLDTVVLVIAGRRARSVAVRSIYEELAPGAVGLLGSSFGTLELAVREGSAASRLRLQVGDDVRVRWRSGRRAVGK